MPTFDNQELRRLEGQRYDQKQALFRREQQRCIQDFKKITGAVSCQHTAEQRDIDGCLDHISGTFRIAGQSLTWDDPYGPPVWRCADERLHGLGCRTLHLPTAMSMYWVGRCQPRLTAPKRSVVDLEFIKELLVIANFRGNFVLASDFDAR